MDSTTKKYVGYGLLAVGAAAAAYYVWGLSTIDERVKITDIKISAVGLTWIRLALTVTNYTELDIPFTGFTGIITAQGYVLSNVELPVPADKRILPKGESVIYSVQSTLNWAQFAALVPNIVTLISSGKWKEVLTSMQPILKGTIFAKNFSAEVDMPLV